MNAIPWKINPISILAAAIALVGAFLPWWGINVSGISFNPARFSWTIWNPPRFNTRVPGAAAVSWNFTLSSVSVLVLVLVATSLIVVGSLTLLRRYLVGGLILSTLAPVIYALAINYVTMNYCLSPLCISGPVGNESVSGVVRLNVAWGFQTGFYIFLAAVFVLIAGLVFNNRLTEGFVTNRIVKSVSTGPTAVACSKCGTSFQLGSNYCPNCGQARTSSPATK